MRPMLVETLRVQALMAQRQAREEEAYAAVEEALALSRAIGYPYLEAKALYTSGLLHTRDGEREHAREGYEQALAICARLGEDLYRPHIKRALGLITPR